MTLDELSDREEIRQLVYRYARGVDRLDQDLLHAVFWDDAEYEGGPNPGTALDFIPAMFAEGGRVRIVYETTAHYMMNLRIELRGDVAFAETYAVAYHKLAATREAIETVLGPAKLADLKGDAPPQQFLVGIRYQDRFEKRGGVWKIARKKLILDWNQVAPYSGISEEGVYSYLTLRGSRDKTDESYTWMGR